MVEEFVEEGFAGAEEAADPFQWLVPITTLFLVLAVVLVWLELYDFYGEVLF